MLRIPKDVPQTAITVTYTSKPNFIGQHKMFGELISGSDALNGLRPRNSGDNFAGDVIQRVIIEVV